MNLINKMCILALLVAGTISPASAQAVDSSPLLQISNAGGPAINLVSNLQVSFLFYHTTPVAGLKFGDPVKKGQLIGYYSQRGHSDIPHKHLTVFPRVNGQNVTPIDTAFLFKKR